MRGEGRPIDVPLALVRHILAQDDLRMLVDQEMRTCEASAIRIA